MKTNPQLQPSAWAVLSFWASLFLVFNIALLNAQSSGPAAPGKELTPEQMMKLAEMKIASPAAYEEAVKMFQQAGYTVTTGNGTKQTDAPKGAAGMTVNYKMARIVFPSVNCQNTTVAEALQYLDILSRQYDTFSADGNKGVRITLREGSTPSNAALNLDLKNIPMIEALRYIAELAQMKYEIEGDRVVVSSGPQSTPQNWFEYASIAELTSLAENGNATAQCELAFRHQIGKGVTKDYTEAAKWYRKATDQGDALGQNQLGSCYLNGNGVTKDTKEAAKWFRKAADQGLALAQGNLGYLYRFGEGVPLDYNESYAWFTLAARGGDADALEQVKKFESAVSPERIQQARERAKELSQQLQSQSSPAK